jgi:pyridoxine 5-phosphate synthase
MTTPHPLLSVNVNAIAQLRNRRDLPWPSVIGLSRIALEAGAVGITVHPRPDERHIRRTDCYDIAMLLRTEFPDREFNIEGYPTEDFLALVEDIRPHQVTLVPDAPGQSTSDHGWDTFGEAGLLAPVIERLKHTNAHANTMFSAFTLPQMRVALFIDADPAVATQAAKIGADRVELYTGPYGHTFDLAAKSARLEELGRTADAARDAGLSVNIGHDLTLDNLPALVARIPYTAEASIGHALTADALIYGMADTVRRYRAALTPPRA